MVWVYRFIFFMSIQLSQNYLLRRLFAPTELSWCLCQNQLATRVEGIFLDYLFYPVDLPASLYASTAFFIIIQVVHFEIDNCKSSHFVLYFKMGLALWVLWISMWIWYIVSPFFCMSLTVNNFEYIHLFSLIQHTEIPRERDSILVFIVNSREAPAKPQQWCLLPGNTGIHQRNKEAAQVWGAKVQISHPGPFFLHPNWATNFTLCPSALFWAMNSTFHQSCFQMFA